MQYNGQVITKIPELVHTSDLTSLLGFSDMELQHLSKKIICILGSSCVGKHALCHGLINLHPDKFIMAGTVTTRDCYQSDFNNNFIQVTDITFDIMKENKEFIYWHLTSTGKYGLKKNRLKELIYGDKYILITHRSLGGIILKSLFPNMMVIELRASFEALSERIKQKDYYIKTGNFLDIYKVDNEKCNNDIAHIFWNESGTNNWYIIDNDIHEPPICRTVINNAYNIIIDRKGMI